jgi:2-iminobutanoate/2-iminopropanoate deaminase
MVEFSNPATVHPPVGAYAHTAAVPAGAAWVFVSGQVGMRADGSVPATLAEQADAAFGNLAACLAAHGLGLEAVVKLTSYVVAGQDLQVVRDVRQRHFGAHAPAATLVFVAGLVSPALLLEVDAIAAKPMA